MNILVEIKKNTMIRCAMNILILFRLILLKKQYYLGHGIPNAALCVIALTSLFSVLACKGSPTWGKSYFVRSEFSQYKKTTEVSNSFLSFDELLELEPERIDIAVAALLAEKETHCDRRDRPWGNSRVSRCLFSIGF